MPEIIAAVDDLIGENHRITISEIAMQMKISVRSARTIIGEELHYRNTMYS
jgi:ribosomal protein S25